MSNYCGEMGTLHSGEIYRYSSQKNPTNEFEDDLRNFYFETALEGKPRASLESGISQIAKTQKGLSKSNFPAILISSSPHTGGSEWNPWHDVFQPDLGYVRYFGDSKGAAEPSLVGGNKVLLSQLKLHSSGQRADRMKAAPLVFFERVAVDGRVKGNVKFHGFGIIERAEVVTQFNPKIGYFANYEFTFAVFSLAEENERFAWSWINARRDPTVKDEESLTLAPSSWRQWVRDGKIESARRRAAISKVTPTLHQRPAKGAREEKALAEIYAFFSVRGRHKFELLASKVVASIVTGNGGHYREGWVTQGSSDGGVDFVGSLRIGEGFSSVEVVVLGQAKCEDPTKVTSGNSLARTVARLKRGWIGAYVTTSSFSEKAQLEIIEDAYPLLRVNGLTLAAEALKLAERGGHSTLHSLLLVLEDEYRSSVRVQRPEDILEI